jgi:hypothetical protein
VPPIGIGAARHIRAVFQKNHRVIITEIGTEGSCAMRNVVLWGRSGSTGRFLAIIDPLAAAVAALVFVLHAPLRQGITSTAGALAER